MGTITKTYTFANGNVADGTHVNANFDQLFDVVNGNIEAANIKDGAVVEAKIGAGAITHAKLAADAVETAEIKDAMVTAAKLATDLNTKALLSGHASAITDAADITVDWSHSATHSVVLDQTTHITMTNPVDGQVYRLILIQESSGAGHTVTWHDTIKWAGGSAPTLTTAVDKADIITLLYAGTTWYASATQNF
jgi:hypothetical protein